MLKSTQSSQGGNMRCPKCGCEISKVVDSRSSDANESIRRRRECTVCGFRYTTYERLEEIPLSVIKKDGRSEPFDRQKIMQGLVRATVKRDIPTEFLIVLIDEVESEIRDSGSTEVHSKDLGNMVLKHLMKLDKVAYIRFASVYRDFNDVEDFADVLRSLS